MTLPRFGAVQVHERPLVDGVAAEAGWLAATAGGHPPAAHLWQGERGLVVPRSCTLLPGWARAARAHPVQVRASGGGVVPQGPGLLNLSAVWRAAARPADSDPIYRALCETIADALTSLGITASAQAVDGSFCDGRFNLAVAGRKLAGTAQCWRRIDSVPVVLAHAVIVVDADPQALTDAANAFEDDLGSDRRYRVDALSSVAAAWRQAHGRVASPTLQAQLTAALSERLIDPAAARCGAAP